ncbi:leucine-rich repeat domain-containing protein [Oscillospiraceae bacterium 44-34]
MKDYKLTTLGREVFAEMARLNNTEPEMIYKTSTHSDRRYIFHYFGYKTRPPLTDIPPLAKLRELDEVTLYDCQVRDISPLAELTGLRHLTISGGPEFLPCDLTPLKELQTLSLHTTPRCNMPKLPGKLSSLSVTGIDDLECLRGMESLEWLNLNNNPGLSDLSPLASCPNLTELSVVDTTVSDLSPLAGHPSLKELTLSSTKVTDVSPLAAIPTLEMIWLYGTAVEDVSCLAALPRLNDLNLRKTQVVDLSAFRGREHILGIERKKLGVKKAGKSAVEIKTAIEELRERLEKLGVTPGPPLKRTDITAFQEKTGVKLPKEYAAFLTQIGDGFQVELDSFSYKFPPLSEVLYNPEGIKKRFSHREAWVWEDDDSATSRKIAAATTNGQLELVDRGCGQSYRLIVCGGAKGEVWDMSDVGIAPYGNGLDFLDWLQDFLNEKAV